MQRSLSFWVIRVIPTNNLISTIFFQGCAATVVFMVDFWDESNMGLYIAWGDFGRRWRSMTNFIFWYFIKCVLFTYKRKCVLFSWRGYFFLPTFDTNSISYKQKVKWSYLFPNWPSTYRPYSQHMKTHFFFGGQGKT